MSGRKDGPEGDVGVRTPMQWSADAHTGFTAAEPWHAPADGWREVNVAMQSADSASLLTLYRRLVHLRAANPALARGDWVPLRASHPAVAAYLRRSAGKIVLVVINISAWNLEDVSLSFDAGALPGGYQGAEVLLGPEAAPPRIGADGTMESYVPFATLGARQTYILRLRP